MRVDVAVAGAGPVGCVLALALAREGRQVVLIEPPPRTAAAFRPIALSQASVMLLERLGAWGGFPATAIESVHVSQAGRFGRTVFTAEDAGLPALGQVADYAALCAALAESARALRVHATIDNCAETADDVRLSLSSGERVQASFLAHAEGGSTGMQEKRYAQDALVAEVEVMPASRGRAWERFTPQGPLALLPHAGRYAVVWGARPERIAALSDAGDAEFLRALQEAFGRKAGSFTRVLARSRMPLALRRRRDRVAGRQVYVGNAAQALHPVAGQGLNLGLRDAWELAEACLDALDTGSGAGSGPATQVMGAGLGSAAFARAFDARRRLDRDVMVQLTDGLIGAFSLNLPCSATVRGTALAFLDAVPPARRFLSRRMMFGARAIP